LARRPSARVEAERRDSDFDWGRTTGSEGGRADEGGNEGGFARFGEILEVDDMPEGGGEVFLFERLGEGPSLAEGSLARLREELGTDVVSSFPDV